MENLFENFSFIHLIWLFFIISAIVPAMKHGRMEATRIRLIRQLERSRKSRVITLVHRQESISLLGIPISKYIKIGRAHV